MKKIVSLIFEVLEKGIEPLRSRITQQIKQDKTYASMDEMVFADREKNYGAYQLRKNYPWHLITAVGLVGSTFLYLCFIPVWLNMENTEHSNYVCSYPVEPIKPVSSSTHTFHFCAPPKVKIQKAVEFKIPKPVPARELPIEDRGNGNDRQTQEKADAISDGVKPENCCPEEVAFEEEPEFNAFIFAEEEPQPINMDEIKKLIGYPQLTRNGCIEGNVVVRVLVDKNGNYRKHRVINQVHPILEKAVTAHIPRLRFTPVIQGGRPIPFWVNIPFRFRGY